MTIRQTIENMARVSQESLTRLPPRLESKYTSLIARKDSASEKDLALDLTTLINCFREDPALLLSFTEKEQHLLRRTFSKLEAQYIPEGEL